MGTCRALRYLLVGLTAMALGCSAMNLRDVPPINTSRCVPSNRDISTVFYINNMIRPLKITVLSVLNTKYGHYKSLACLRECWGSTTVRYIVSRCLLLTGSFSVFNEISTRSARFINSCLHSRYHLVRSKALFMVTIIRLLVQMYGFVVVGLNGGGKILCRVLSRLIMIIFVICVRTIFRLISFKQRHQ